MSIDPRPDPISQRRLSDGTLMVERENEFMQITHEDDVMHEHITVPKGNPSDAHWSVYTDDGRIGGEDLDY